MIGVVVNIYEQDHAETIAVFLGSNDGDPRYTKSASILFFTQSLSMDDQKYAWHKKNPTIKSEKIINTIKISMPVIPLFLSDAKYADMGEIISADKKYAIKVLPIRGETGDSLEIFLKIGIAISRNSRNTKLTSISSSGSLFICVLSGRSMRHT